jgi:hypothetical protein
MRSVRILALSLLLVLAAGCGVGNVLRRNAEPTTPPVPVPSQHSTAVVHLVTGRALDSRNVAISGVAVGLKSSTSSTTCSSCGFYSGITSTTGIYSISVPDGTYVAACKAGSLTCRFAALPDAATVTITVSGADVNANLTISAPSPTPTPTQVDSDGTTVSGHVYTESGRPVAHATVEFRKIACPDCMPQPWTTTDANGAYSINLDAGVYGAECPDPFNCGVKGNTGGPYPVTVPPSTTVDFIVCNSSNDYPACLRK